MKRLLLLSLTVLALAAFVACGSEDNDGATNAPPGSSTPASGATRSPAASPSESGSSGSDQKDIEDVITRVAASTPADIDYFVAHLTARLLQSSRFKDEAGCRAKAAACIGGSSKITGFIGTTVNGDEAMTTAQFVSGSGPETRQTVVHLVRENGVWKLDSFDEPTGGAASPAS